MTELEQAIARLRREEAEATVLGLTKSYKTLFADLRLVCEAAARGEKFIALLRAEQESEIKKVYAVLHKQQAAHAKELAEARLEEARWWEHLVPSSEHQDETCIYCQRIAKLQAAMKGASHE